MMILKNKKKKSLKISRITTKVDLESYLKFEGLSKKLNVSESYLSIVMKEGNFKEIKKITYTLATSQKKERSSYYGPLISLDYEFIPKILDEGYL